MIQAFPAPVRQLCLAVAVVCLAVQVAGCDRNAESVSANAPLATDSGSRLPAGHPPMADATPPAGSTGAADVKSVRVSVRLNPALRTKTKPGDTLYVFARAAQGPVMPLAIVRKQVKDLPLTVTLDDSMAMMPNLRMSNFPELIIGARISKTGDAIPKPGDLEGHAGPLSGDTANVEISSVVGASAQAAPPAPLAPAPTGEPKTFKHANSGTQARLDIPADVRAKWKSVELTLSGRDVSTHTVRVAVGDTLKLDHGLALRVVAYVPAFRSDSGTVTSASNNPENPAVLVQLLDKNKPVHEGWVFQKLSDFNTFSSDRIHVQLMGASGTT
jgi:hypothetical protein